MAPDPASPEGAELMDGAGKSKTSGGSGPAIASPPITYVQAAVPRAESELSGESRPVGLTSTSGSPPSFPAHRTLAEVRQEP